MLQMSQGLAAVNAMPPQTDRLRQVIRMDQLLPTPAFDLLERQAGVLHPLRIKVIDVAAGRCRKDLLRQGLCE